MGIQFSKTKSQPNMKVLLFVALLSPLLWLSLRPKQMLKPVPPTMVDTMAVDTDMVDTMVTDMADTVALTDMEDTTTARGPLMPNQRPQLKPHPKPRLMPKLPLMPTTDTTAVDTDTVTDTD